MIWRRLRFLPAGFTTTAAAFGFGIFAPLFRAVFNSDRDGLRLRF